MPGKEEDVQKMQTAILSFSGGRIYSESSVVLNNVLSYSRKQKEETEVVRIFCCTE